MLRRIERFTGLAVEGADGEIGIIEDVLIDGKYWVIRYFLVDTGSWLAGRRVLISTAAVRAPHWKRKALVTDLSRDQVRISPQVDFHHPITRSQEDRVNRFYGWPVYWDISRYPEYPGETGTEYPEVARPEYHGASRIYYSRSPEEEQREEAESGTPPESRAHLLGAGRILGYRIQATDGEIGHIHDLMFDDVTWAIRYLVVDTRAILPGKKVLLTPSHILRMETGESRMYVNVRRDVIRNSPEYDSNKVLDRDFEEKVYDYYSQHSY